MLDGSGGSVGSGCRCYGVEPGVASSTNIDECGAEDDEDCMSPEDRASIVGAFGKDSREGLQRLLEVLDRQDEPHEDLEVARVLRSFREDAAIPEDARKVLDADVLLFDLNTAQAGGTTEWGTFFGPWGSVRRGDTLITAPPTSAITPETIQTWRSRHGTVKHPALCARYADAAWDLAKLAGMKPDIRDCHKAIDAYATITGWPHEVREACNGLARALWLALKIGDKARVMRVQAAMVALAEQGDFDEQRYAALTALSLLRDSKGIDLSHEEDANIVAAVERALRAATDMGAEVHPLPDDAASVAWPLMALYRKENRNAEVERVARAAAAVCEAWAAKGSGMLATAYLEKAYDLYTAAGLVSEADRMLVALKEAGARVRDELAPIGTTMEIPNEQMEQWLNAVVGNTLDEGWRRIVGEFFSTREALRRQMMEAHKDTTLYNLLPFDIVDDEQRVARVGSLEEDPEGRLVHYTMQQIAFSSGFLALALDGLFKKYELTPEQFVDRITDSTSLRPSRREILLRAIRAYREQDYIVSAHLLVPQIEAAIRVLLRAAGRPSQRKNRGVFEELTLDGILRDEGLQKAITEDIAFYLRALLTDRRACNIRNAVCHGLVEVREFGRRMSDWLVYVTMLLSMIRVEPKPNRPDGSADPSPGAVS